MGNPKIKAFNRSPLPKFIGTTPVYTNTNALSVGSAAFKQPHYLLRKEIGNTNAFGDLIPNAKTNFLIEGKNIKTTPDLQALESVIPTDSFFRIKNIPGMQNELYQFNPSVKTINNSGALQGVISKNGVNRFSGNIKFDEVTVPYQEALDQQLFKFAPYQQVSFPYGNLERSLFREELNESFPETINKHGVFVVDTPMKGSQFTDVSFDAIKPKTFKKLIQKPLLVDTMNGGFSGQRFSNTSLGLDSFKLMNDIATSNPNAFKLKYFTEPLPNFNASGTSKTAKKVFNINKPITDRLVKLNSFLTNNNLPNAEIDPKTGSFIMPWPFLEKQKFGGKIYANKDTEN